MLVKAGGFPSPRIREIPEIDDFSAKNILAQSMAHEKQALEFYHLLLEIANGINDEVAEFALRMIQEEGSHHQEMQEIIADFS
ncbi:MAG: hypothetical protein HC908_06125 [Calothrix sp. SM1_7_51]|nr:hypothetical protein [Calothrix sp. SM1_7_51]